MALYQNATFNNQTLPASNTQSTGLKASSQNQLTWQSAFWAIVTIALATMADAPGTVRGYPKDLTFYLKISPLACLFDTLYAVGSIIESASRPGSDHGFQQAMNQLVEWKIGSTTCSSEIPRSPIRFILFIFGAVPQAVKIFACRGVLLTQVISACYLASFFLDEIVLIYGRRNGLGAGVSISPSERGMISKFMAKARVLYDFFMLEILLLVYWAIPASMFRKDRSGGAKDPVTWLLAGPILINLPLLGIKYWTWLRRQISRQVDSNTSSQPSAENGGERLSSIWNETFEIWMTRMLTWSMIGSVLSIVSSAMLINVKSLGGSAATTFQQYCLFLAIGGLSWGQIGMYPSIEVTSGLRLPHGSKISLRDEIQGVMGVFILSTEMAVLLFMVWIIALLEKFEDGGELLVQHSKVVVTLTVLIVIALMFLSGAIALFPPFERLFVRRDNAQSRSFPTITYCSLTIAALTLYYYNVYEPTGTYRPSWIDWLG